MQTGIIPAEVVLNAYSRGIFPMADEGGVYWVEPKIRGIIPLDDRFHIPRGLRKALRKHPFQIRFNTAFREVMIGCSEREETWIDEVILESYCRLHDLGYAHSVECWDEEGLQGGLYGVSLGKAFFGESMFSRKTDASKIALVSLVARLRENNFEILDTQWMTEHLKTFGGIEVPQETYLGMLAASIEPGSFDRKSESEA